MRTRYLIVLLFLVVLLSVFGWSVSVPAVLLTWILGLVGLLVFLGTLSHGKTVRHFGTYRLVLWLLIAVCLALFVNTL